MERLSKPKDWLCRHWKDVQANWRNTDDPMKLGLAWSKGFVALLFVLAFIPYSSGSAGWELKVWTLIKSPPNEIGDTLAGIAGALAFLWIIVTVQLQSKELKAQRLELKLARKEYAKMAEAQRDQVSTLSEQKFEATFFEMLSTQNQIVQSIDLRDRDNRVTHGRDCFAVFYTRFARTYKRYKPNDCSEIKKIQHAYELFWRDNQLNLSHYFRFLYNGFRIVSESPVAEEKHGRLLRALLSDQELLLIFYNCLTPNGRRFKRYAVEFQLFDNLPSELLADASHKELLDEFSAQLNESEDE
ncbi:putative phage abortive infection protein [Aliiroseovarius crassostreae]|uniref:putative phage abortive infection protein n=1 Tax=Aliiroseovarius crassostreae TaxID=154981 RepID=UPI002207324D|nr:putative phage abortive infection protein [Aliiroseovarius crassostreae]UWP92656.1 putative phage abortive infection protein [Aliiroseovarius crassostreae]